MTDTAQEAMRFLISSDDTDIDALQAFVSSRYVVVSRHKAQTNGIRASLDGNPILLWPSEADFNDMSRFGDELAQTCPDVKLIDPEWQPPTIYNRGWDFNKFKEQLYELERLIFIQTPANFAAQQQTGAAASPSVAAAVYVAQSAPGPINRDSPDSGPPSSYPVERSMDAAPSAPGESRPFMESADNGGAGPTATASQEAPGHERYPTDSAITDDPDELLTLAYSRQDEPGDDRELPSRDISWQASDRAPVPGEWPEPLDLTRSLHRGLPLPLELVPAALRPLIQDCSRRTGIDGAAFFCGFLGAISGLANDFIRLQPKQNDHTWTVRAVIWPLAIGAASSGKTPGIEEGMRWVQKKDAAAVVENTHKRKDHEHRMKQYEDECLVARKHKLPRPPEPETPTLREFWVSRGTTEGVTRVLEHSPKVVWYVDEASSLINSLDRYAAGGKGSGDREFVLMLYNGGPGKNTLAGKTVSLRNASAVLCGGTTPAAMLKCAGGKLQPDGLLARMMIFMIPNMKEGEDSTPDASAYAAYNQILDGLLDMHGAATVLLSPDAQLIYNEFCGALRAVITTEENDQLADHMSKWFGMAPRLMLIYFMIERASRGNLIADGSTIPAEIAQQVCRLLMDWQRSHLQEFWNDLMADKAGRKFSQTVARYILANPQLKELRFRDHVAKPHFREVDRLKSWEIKEAMNTLINGAWLTPGPKNNSYGVATNYEINPKIPAMFADQRKREVEIRAMRREELQRMRTPGSDDAE